MHCLAVMLISLKSVLLTMKTPYRWRTSSVRNPQSFCPKVHFALIDRPWETDTCTWSTYISAPNLKSVLQTVPLWECWPTDTQTYGLTGPILLPRLLMQEVKKKLCQSQLLPTFKLMVHFLYLSCSSIRLSVCPFFSSIQGCDHKLSTIIRTLCPSGVQQIPSWLNYGHFTEKLRSGLEGLSYCD